MKKVLGWLLIIFCSAVMFLYVIGNTLLWVEGDDTYVKMSNQELVATLLGFFIIMSILIAGIRFGMKIIKKERIIPTIKYDKDLNIHLSGQIQYRDYRNLMLKISFSRPIHLFPVGLQFLAMLYILVSVEFKESQFYYYSFFVILLILIFSHIYIILHVRKQYSTNIIFKDKLEYHLTNESLHIKGDSFESTQKWARFYRIKETKTFFMFYQGEMLATLIDKKMFTVNELLEFQQFIKSLNIPKK